MGLADLYPFVISPTTADKLRFVHELLAGQREAARSHASRTEKSVTDAKEIVRRPAAAQAGT
jgi:hypothetical protein